jgi:hypothetical protein
MATIKTVRFNENNDRRRVHFNIATEPRRHRRAWVRNARRAYVHNTGATLTVAEAWKTWDVRECGPMTWTTVVERNGIRCAA